MFLDGKYITKNFEPANMELFVGVLGIPHSGAKLKMRSVQVVIFTFLTYSETFLTTNYYEKFNIMKL